MKHEQTSAGGAEESDRQARIAEDFALMLETACGDFEALQRFLTGELRLVSHDPIVSIGAQGTINMALAKSFLFNTIRAYRIVEHSKGLLKITSEDRKKFIRAVKPAVGVRDVNEHGFDAQEYQGKSSKATVRPTIHHHQAVGGALDETAMMIGGPEMVQMGPLNLFDVYLEVAKMRALAGFASLPPSLPM